MIHNGNQWVEITTFATAFTHIPSAEMPHAIIRIAITVSQWREGFRGRSKEAFRLEIFRADSAQHRRRAIGTHPMAVLEYVMFISLETLLRNEEPAHPFLAELKAINLCRAFGGSTEVDNTKAPHPAGIDQPMMCHRLAGCHAQAHDICRAWPTEQP